MKDAATQFGRLFLEGEFIISPF